MIFMKWKFNCCYLLNIIFVLTTVSLKSKWNICVRNNNKDQSILLLNRISNRLLFHSIYPNFWNLPYRGEWIGILGLRKKTFCRWVSRRNGWDWQRIILKFLGIVDNDWQLWSFQGVSMARATYISICWMIVLLQNQVWRRSIGQHFQRQHRIAAPVPQVSDPPPFTDAANLAWSFY